MIQPLAERIRPKTLDEIVGQRHLLDKDAVFRRVVESGEIRNMIFYGPSGVGKTTVASIIATKTKRTLYKLNGTRALTSDIKSIIDEVGSLSAPEGVLLYLDEIQYFNKKQQQLLLECMENGEITLIASTTENPYFYVYNAILSRATVFEFKPLTSQEIVPAIRRAFKIMSKETSTEYDLSDEVCLKIAQGCGGDVRKAINAVELLAAAAPSDAKTWKISVSDVEQVSQKSAMRYDRDGDSHYDILSALQKSVRGSDPDAALHYLARLLAAGDLPSACRRLLVMASEDIGLAYPLAITIVKACVDSALQLGLPEAQLPLAQAAVLLATAPKSNSAAVGIWAAMKDVQNGLIGDIPPHLKDAHYEGAAKLGRGVEYKYPHDFHKNWVEQQYLPDTLKNKAYYRYGENKTEQASKRYWDEIKKRVSGKQ